MNNKGQALIEFVLILPIFIFIIFVMVDFGLIFNEKNHLENDSFDIVNLYNSNTSLEEIESIYNDNKIVIKEEEDFYRIEISKEINLITPGLDKIFGSPYIISVERVVPNA